MHVAYYNTLIYEDVSVTKGSCVSHAMGGVSPGREVVAEITLHICATFFFYRYILAHIYTLSFHDASARL